LWSGWYSDRISWRRRLAAGGYGTTVIGLGLLVAITSWPQVIVARALAWMGRGLRQPIRSAMLAGSVEKKDLGKAFGFHEALDTAGELIGPAVALLLLSTGHGFRTIFWAALAPGVICVILFALITRDPRRHRGRRVACQLDGRCPQAGHCFWFSQWNKRRRRPRVNRGRRCAVDGGQSGSLARPGIGSVRGRGADLVGETTKTRLIDRWPGQSSRSSAARTSGSRPCSTG